jgi:hypothetical protein
MQLSSPPSSFKIFTTCRRRRRRRTTTVATTTSIACRSTSTTSDRPGVPAAFVPRTADRSPCGQPVHTARLARPEAVRSRRHPGVQQQERSLRARRQDLRTFPSPFLLTACVVYLCRLTRLCGSQAARYGAAGALARAARV